MVNKFEGYFGWLLLVLYIVIYIVEIISYKNGVDNIYFYLTTYLLNNLIRIIWPVSGYLLYTYSSEKIFNETNFSRGILDSFFTGLFSEMFAILFYFGLTITVIVIFSFFNTFSKKRLDNIYKKK